MPQTGFESGGSARETVGFASQLKVENSMFCRHGFTARGQVILDGATIGGRIDLSAQLVSPGQASASASGRCPV